METKVISFDVDGTLVQTDFADRFWFEEIPKLYAKSKNLNLDEAISYVRDSYSQVGSEDIRWYQPEYWFDRFGIDKNPDSVLEEISDSASLFSDVVEILENLNGDYRLIVISNAHRNFLKIQLKEVEFYFSEIYSCVSDLVRVKKDVGVYLKVCSDLGLDPKRLVHVGDDRKFDYDIPREVGIKAFLLDRDGNWHDEERIIRDLSEILDKID